MKKIITVFTMIMVLGNACVMNALAGETDLLIKKLVEKDVLTPFEAQILKDETLQDVAKQNANRKNGALPSWVQKIKMKGDIRVRYQNEEKDTTASSGSVTNAKRERARVRFRLGLEAKPVSGWKVNAGLATGSDDPRSTNQTMQDNFSTKGIQLDYAYATNSINNYVDILAGKIVRKKVLWAPSDLLWDGDVNLEGAAVKLDIQEMNAWLNAGYFIIDEVKAGADPSIFFAQPGTTLEMDNMKFKGALNYYATNSVKGFDYSNIVDGAGTNSTTGGDFKYDYDCWGLSAELGINLQEDAEVDEIINYVTLFGDYITNPDPTDENTGYLFGVKFGDKKAKKPGQWQAKVLYRELEKDAWLDFLPDSDFLGGDTNAKGFELIFKYAIAKNITLGLDYYRTETLNVPTGSSKEEQDLMQVDCVVKF